MRARHPDVIFLAEAFTRPKMMHRLAKIGFSQSYTYFTWRNTKHELTEYLTELSTTAGVRLFSAEFFRQHAGHQPLFPAIERPCRAFSSAQRWRRRCRGCGECIRDFELCEAAALPGREEYLDSEKYEIKASRLRAARATSSPRSRGSTASASRIRALQQQVGLTFYNAYNDQVLVYGKVAAAGTATSVVVAVNLDPFNPQDATFELPLWQLGLAAIMPP